MTNYFEQLNAVNVNGYKEQKNGLTYLSWAYAWGELKKRYPLSYYTVYEDARGLNYFTDGKTAYVKTGVTVVTDGERLEHIEYLPVMDNRNRSIPTGDMTSFDVNKSIQRSLTKAVARHGLGLYIYAGEDLPEEEAREQAEKAREQEAAAEEARVAAMTQGLSDGAKRVLAAAEERWGKCDRGTMASAKLRGVLSELGVKKLGELPEDACEAALARIQSA